MQLKAQSENKAQRQLRPESYVPEFFKSRALVLEIKEFKRTVSVIKINTLCNDMAMPD